jgi:CO/xanthine dehydrogenase Mo-binding subunit
MNRAETLPGLHAIGMPHKRVDGKLKVTGAAHYAGDFSADGLTHGFVVSSTIATGRIVSIDARLALETSGVLLVLTHENRQELPLDDRPYKDQVAPGGSPFRPLRDDRVCVVQRATGRAGRSRLVGVGALCGVTGEGALRNHTSSDRYERSRGERRAAIDGKGRF